MRPIIIVCLSALLLAGCKSSGLENGDKAVTKQMTPYAISEDKYEELATYGNKHNETAMNNMAMRGEVGMLDEGTEVTIVDAYTDEGMLSEVELDDGERVFVDNDFLEKE